MSAHRLGHRHAEEPDRTGAGDDDALAGNQTAELGEPIHGGTGGDHQRRFLVRHAVGDRDQRVDVVDLVFAEATVGGEAVGAVTLVDVAVVQSVVVAGRVHALAATLALAAAGMNLHRDALADPVLVDAGPERHHRAHVFVAGREVLVEGVPALNGGRRAVIDDLEIGGADRHRVDAHQHLGLLRHRHRLFREGRAGRDRRAPKPSWCRGSDSPRSSSLRRVRTSGLLLSRRMLKAEARPFADA